MLHRTSARKSVNPKLNKIHSKHVIDTHDDFIKMPFTACIQGARGSGKTVACVQWVRHMEQEGYINRTFLISPTAETNVIFRNLKTLDQEDVCSDPTCFQRALLHVMHEIKEATKTHKEALRYKVIHDKYLKNHSLDLTEQSILESRNFAPMEVPPLPRCLLICDDVQGTDLFTSRRTDRMLHMVIKHRHIPLSIIMMAQTFHGIPRAIRLNCTVYIVFATSDEKQLRQIYEHFGNMVPRERFFDMYRYATSTSHGFFLIDTDPKTPESRFRSGFNEFLTYK